MTVKKVHISVSHDLTITSRSELPDSIYSDNEIDNPDYIKAVDFGKKAWGIDPKIVLHTRESYNGIITTTLPRGYMLQLISALKKNGFSLDFENKMALGVPSSARLTEKYLSERPLRPYQKNSFNASERLKRGVIILPTGGGKTRVAQEIIDKTAKRTIILMHNDMLSQQWVEGIEKAFGTKIGIFKDKSTPYHTADICISTFQSITATIKRHPEAFRRYAETFGLVLIDEAHHVPARDFLNVTRYWPAERMIALTASKKRSDGSESILYRSVGPIIDEVVYLPPEYVLPAHVLRMDSNTVMLSEEDATSKRRDVLNDKWIKHDESRIKRFRRSLEIGWERDDKESKKDFESKIAKMEPDLTLKEVRAMARTMMATLTKRNAPLRAALLEDSLSTEMKAIAKEDRVRRKKKIIVNPWDIFQMSIIGDDVRNQCIVNMAYKSKVKTMIVTDRTEHADRIASMFPRGSNILVLHGKVGRAELKKRRLVMGDADTIVTTYSSFGEGIDVPSLGLGIMASPSKSIIRIPQTIGRVLRPDGKKTCGYVVDIVDSETVIGVRSHRFRTSIYNENIELRKWKTSYNGHIEDTLEKKTTLSDDFIQDVEIVDVDDVSLDM